MFFRKIISSKCLLSNQLRFKSTVPPKLATTPNKFNAKSSAFNLTPILPEGLYYHPAPSSLNPEITPKAFLPESDMRKNSPLYYPEEKSQITENVKYMPIISKCGNPKKYELTAENIADIQKLRNEGATRKQIREKYNITDTFISLTTKSNKVVEEQKLLNKQFKKLSAKTLKAKKLKEIQKLQWERDA